MNPEKRKQISELAVVQLEARQRVDAIWSQNSYCATHERSKNLAVALALAERDFYEANKALSDAIISD